MLLLTACETYQYDEFRPIVLDNASVSFDVLNNGFLLRTTVPHAETTISISPKYRNQKPPFITSVIVNGVNMSTPDSFDGEWPYLEERPVLKGDWGNIDYDYSQNKFTINIQLYENNSDTDKNMKIKLGYGYEYVDVEIIQTANNNIDK